MTFSSDALCALQLSEPANYLECHSYSRLMVAPMRLYFLAIKNDLMHRDFRPPHSQLSFTASSILSPSDWPSTDSSFHPTTCASTSHCCPTLADFVPPAHFYLSTFQCETLFGLFMFVFLHVPRPGLKPKPAQQ